MNYGNAFGVPASARPRGVAAGAYGLCNCWHRPLTVQRGEAPHVPAAGAGGVCLEGPSNSPFNSKDKTHSLG